MPGKKVTKGKRKKPKRVHVGDVIQSSAFANVMACYEGEEDHPRQVSEEVSHADEHVEEWGTRSFVVTDTAFEGGGTGMGPHDVYPDGWHVLASLLNEDGSYDPDAPCIEFYQSGCFTNMVRKVKVVGQMRRTFVPA